MSKSVLSTQVESSQSNNGRRKKGKTLIFWQWHTTKLNCQKKSVSKTTLLAFLHKKGANINLQKKPYRFRKLQKQTCSREKLRAVVVPK